MARQSRRAVVVPHLQEPDCGDVIAPGVVIRAELHSTDPLERLNKEVEITEDQEVCLSRLAMARAIKSSMLNSSRSPQPS